MKRKYYLAGMLIVACIALLTGCDGAGPAEPTPPAAVPVVAQDSGIVADAVIEPARSGGLRFEIGGDVAEVLVQEGDAVEVGYVLVRLEPTDLERAVARAELSLRQAEVGLIEAETGVRQSEINQRKAELRLEKLLEPPDEADVQAAETAVSNAKLAYREAEMNRTSVEHALSVGKDVEAARHARNEAYRRYQNLVENKGREDTATEGARIVYLEALGEYNRLVERGELDRTTATNAVTRAQLATRDAQNALDRLLEGPSENDIEAAEMDVEAAQEDVKRAKSNAEAAQTNVASAHLALEATLSDLESAALAAPFDSVVAAVEVDPGDSVAPGQVVVVLATLNHLQAVTVDMTELNVAQIQVGDEALVTVDAMPDAEMKGTVDRIGLQARNYQGDVVYPVYVELAEAVAGLRWGMTAVVTIPRE